MVVEEEEVEEEEVFVAIVAESLVVTTVVVFLPLLFSLLLPFVLKLLEQFDWILPVVLSLVLPVEVFQLLQQLFFQSRVLFFPVPSVVLFFSLLLKL